MTSSAGINSSLLRAGALSAEAATPTQAVRALTTRFVGSAKQFAFDGHGDYEYWSHRTKHFCVVGAEHLVRVGLALPPGANAAIAPQRAAFLDQLRSSAFAGAGDQSYWSRRCKEAAFDATASARVIENKAEDHVPGATGAPAGPVSAAVAARTARFLVEARDLAFAGYGDYAYWSRRTKQLAFESLAYATDVAAIVGNEVNPRARAVLEGLVSATKQMAFEGHGDQEYWSMRCKQLCNANTARAGELGLALTCAQ